MDVSPLYASAARIDEVADVLRHRASLIALHTSTMRWHSPASRAYFVRIDDISATLAAAAVRLGALAERIRRHAAAVARGA